MPKKLTELQKRGYLLPEIINPDGQLHVCVPVPNEPSHIRAFLGQLEMLSYWWTWDRDVEKRGKDAALVWRGIVDEVRDFIQSEGNCDMTFDVRQSPDDCNILQKTFDGEAWLDFADIRDCVESITIVKQPKIWRIFEGDVQYSYDGDTYITYNDSDGPGLGMPSPTDGMPSGEDARCLRAKNVVAFMVQSISETLQQFQLGAAVLGLVATVMGIIATLGAASLILPAAVTGFLSSLANSGAQFIDTLFTDSLLDELECDIYDVLETDGSMTSAGYTALVATLAAKASTNIRWDVVYRYINMIGIIGLVASGLPSSGGIGSCDTSPCDDTIIREYDLTKLPSPFLAKTKEFQEVVEPPTQGFTFGSPAAKWVSGKGYVNQLVKAISTNNYLWIDFIKIVFSHSVDLNKVEVDLDWQKPASYTTGTDRPFEIIFWSPSAVQEAIYQSDFRGNIANGEHTVIMPYTSFGAPGHKVFAAGSEMAIRVRLAPGNFAAGAYPTDGYAHIKKVRFYGSDL